MLHWQNVEHVLRNGICCKGHENADPNYVNIGHKQLIEDRNEYDIEGVDGAGNLGEYVPFYFAGHSPMLLQIMSGRNAQVEQRPQNDIVFLLSSFDLIKQHHLEFVFSDMHAKRALARFYNNEEAFKHLKWHVIKSRDWKNTEEDFSRMDYKQAEFLVRNIVPVGCISHIVVYTEERKQYFFELVKRLNLDIEIAVDVRRRLYY